MKLKSESYSLLGGQNSKNSPYNQGPHEFRQIVNMDFKIPGALTKRDGSTLYSGATVSGKITGAIEFERLSGASYLVLTANTNAYTVTQGAFSAFKTGLRDNALFDFVTYVDRLFGANGQDFFRFDGSVTSNYSLPPGLTASFGVTAIAGGGGAIPPGTYLFGYGYMNDRGYLGPVSNGVTVAFGVTGYAAYYGLTTPSGYGITAIALYRTEAGQPNFYGTTFTASSSVGVTDVGWPLTANAGPEYLWFTMAPRYLALQNNQLFMAGFSGALSTAFWSDIGEPEGVDPQFFAEFRTNDGDRITGLKPYNGALVVSKERSLHRVSGDNPSNFSIQEITDQYGCLSHRAMVVFEDLLWLLDAKGICEFNGANIKIVSNPVEDIFKTMNVTAAKDQAVGVHKREDNQVWFGIPVGDSTVNNVTVIYDYLSQAWAIHRGFNPAVFFRAKGALGAKTVFFGGYSGNVFHFGSSMFGDSGQAMTCLIQTHFLAPRGQTTENQYRRFYINTNPQGTTQAIGIAMKANYSDTVSLTRTMYQATFQSRIDFGIPAKSISAEVSHVSATLPFNVFGFTFESRHQRAT